MRDLQDQIAARRDNHAAASAEPGLLDIGADTFVAQLPRPAVKQAADGHFPESVCLIATDFPKGGAIDRRELFAPGPRAEGDCRLPRARWMHRASSRSSCR